jgi:hypothetical protein
VNGQVPKIAALQMSFKIGSYDILENIFNGFDYIFSDL